MTPRARVMDDGTCLARAIRLIAGAALVVQASGCGMYQRVEKAVTPAPPPARVDQLDPSRYVISSPAKSRDGSAAQPKAKEGKPDSIDAATSSGPPVLGAAPKASSNPGEASEEQHISDPDSWQPSWWSDRPRRGDGKVSVCATAEAEELIDARKKAVAAGREQLRAVLEGGRMPEAPESVVDSVKLKDGRYRAFVRLTAPAR